MFHGFMDFVPQFLDLSRFLEVPSFLRLACHHSEKFSIHQILCEDQLVILIQCRVDCKATKWGMQNWFPKRANYTSITLCIKELGQLKLLMCGLYLITIVLWKLLKSWRQNMLIFFFTKLRTNVTSCRVWQNVMYCLYILQHCHQGGGERESIMGNWRQNWGDFPTSPLP